MAALAALIGAGVLFGCTARQSGLSIAPPKVYSDAETRRSLTQQSDRVVAAAQSASVGTLQQFSGLRSAQELSLRGGYSGVPVPVGGTPPPVPTPPAAPSGAVLPALPVGVPSGFGALISESLDDLAAKEAEIESIRLLYAADTAIAGKHARLYMVRFDIMLNPSRQNFLTYPFRALDCFHLDNEWTPQCRGLRNYTEDFQAVVRFTLPTLQGRAPVEVYAVQPSSQTLTAIDSMASAQGMELAAAAVWNGVTAQGEYETRAEEQFAEQRKFPLIQGIVDSPTEFRFIFNPRRHTVRRSAFVSWIPGVGRYSTTLSLDPGVRRVYAYLLVRDPDNLASDLAALRERRESASCAREPSLACGTGSVPTAEPKLSGAGDDTKAEVAYRMGASGYEQRFLSSADLALTSQVKLSGPEELADTVPPLGLIARGRYVRYGNPYRNDPLFFEDPAYPPKVCPQEGGWCDEDLGARFIDVALPVETHQVFADQWTIAIPDHGHLLRVTPPLGCGATLDPRRVQAHVYLCPTEDGCTASGISALYRGRNGEDVLLGLSALPERPAKGGALDLRLHIEAGGCTGWTQSTPYKGPWGKAAAAAVEPTKSAKAGGTFIVNVPARLDVGTVRSVRTILFGEHVARVVDVAKRETSDAPHGFTVIVPESLGSEVDLIAEIDVIEADPTRPQLSAPTREVTRYVNLGRFAYVPHSLTSLH